MDISHQDLLSHTAQSNSNRKYRVLRGITPSQVFITATQFALIKTLTQHTNHTNALSLSAV